MPLVYNTFEQIPPDGGKEDFIMSEVLLRKDVPAQAQWQTSHIYASQEEWEKDFQWVQEKAKELAAYAGTLKNGKDTVLSLLKTYADIRIVNLDLLTYAGRPENLPEDPRHVFARGDVCERELVSRLFSEYDFDTVIHFAAESHVDRSISDPDIFVRTNVMGTLNLLRCAMDSWFDGTWKPGKKYLQVSTDEVYGALGPEGFFTETTPLSPHSPYSASKASGDLFVLAFRDTYGMPVNITRCSNNYGPNQYPEKLIPLMIRNAMQHKPLPVYGDGLQVRDWLYVYDHCRAIDLVASRGRAGEIYNVGGHNERTNLEIVRTILRQLHDRLGDDEINDGLIRHVEDRLGHDRRYAIDPAKIRRELGWAPETSFETGIQKTIDWYLSNPDWLESAGK